MVNKTSTRHGCVVNNTRTAIVNLSVNQDITNLKHIYIKHYFTESTVDHSVANLCLPFSASNGKVALESTLIRYRSKTYASDRYIIDINRGPCIWEIRCLRRDQRVPGLILVRSLSLTLCTYIKFDDSFMLYSHCWATWQLMLAWATFGMKTCAAAIFTSSTSYNITVTSDCRLKSPPAGLFVQQSLYIYSRETKAPQYWPFVRGIQLVHMRKGQWCGKRFYVMASSSQLRVRMWSAQTPRPRLNIKTVLSTYGNFHVKDKTAVRTSYLLHGNCHTW